MRAVFLVPRRPDQGLRDRLWEWCRRRWQQQMPDVPIYEGEHLDGPFNRSAAINRAARLADVNGPWDVAVIIDADVFHPIPHVLAAIESAAAGKVTWAHRRWRNIAERHLKRLLADPDTFGPVPAEAHDMDLLVDVTNPISWSCCVAVPRATFDDMGGFDERFRGWGFEDGAWAALVRALYPWSRVDGDMYHLDHPRSDERIILGEPRSTASADYVRNALLGRRYMVAAIRDYAAGDQQGEEHLSADMVAVHVRNLTMDDQKFLAMAAQRGMPEADWRTWWPTLEELRDGAKAYHSDDAARRDVTVAVHTDGRRDYIARAIPSLLERVTGPVVKRVIFDDSGDPAYKAWLDQEFGPSGFYVVGPSTRLGYTGSMRALWSYLDRRCSSHYVFLAEDDFLYDRDVDLVPMIETIEANPHLRQLALLRHPFYPRELEAGSIIAEHPEAYELRNSRPHPFLEHRLYFTANPSLFRRSLMAIPWPLAPSSERVYTEQLNRDPLSRFAYWGSGEEWITHIGAERVGTGY